MNNLMLQSWGNKFLFLIMHSVTIYFFVVISNYGKLVSWITSSYVCLMLQSWGNVANMYELLTVSSRKIYLPVVNR